MSRDRYAVLKNTMRFREDDVNVGTGTTDYHEGISTANGGTGQFNSRSMVLICNTEITNDLYIGHTTGMSTEVGFIWKLTPGESVSLPFGGDIPLTFASNGVGTCHVAQYE